MKVMQHQVLFTKGIIIEVNPIIFSTKDLYCVSINVPETVELLKSVVHVAIDNSVYALLQWDLVITGLYPFLNSDILE